MKEYQMQPEGASAHERDRKHPTVSRDTFEVQEAMKEPGCPVCTVVERAVAARIESLAYESVTDPAAREELRESLALCAVHGPIWLANSGPLGTAIVYNDVLNKLRRAVQSSDKRNGGGGLGERFQSLLGGGRGSEESRTLAASLEPSRPCPACAYSIEVEGRMCAGFSHGLGNRSFVEAYERHPLSLCLPHFRSVLRRTASHAHIETLVRVQEARWATTCEELSEVVRKFDYRYQHEERGPEFAAPARAVEQVAGRLPTQVNPPSTQ
jgi:hypothetical protein